LETVDDLPMKADFELETGESEVKEFVTLTKMAVLISFSAKPSVEAY
jgi:hypothetical protein